MSGPRVGEHIASLKLSDIRELPVGTIIHDASGYWKAVRRHHVKTTSATWATFFGTPQPERVVRAVRERWNSVTPGPLGAHVRIVTLPRNQPTREDQS